MEFRIWYPIKPMRITQRFGENKVPFYKEIGMDGHNGWDMVGHMGQLIRAAHDGIVTFTGEDGSGGLGVVIRTLEPFEYKGEKMHFKTIYWHCLPNSFKVKPGDIVKVGDPIAKCDNTGKSTGSHLHFGLKPIEYISKHDWWSSTEWSNGYKGAIDPKPYWTGYFAEDKKVVISTLKKILELLKLMLKVKTNK